MDGWDALLFFAGLLLGAAVAVPVGKALFPGTPTANVVLAAAWAFAFLPIVVRRKLRGAPDQDVYEDGPVGARSLASLTLMGVGGFVCVLWFLATGVIVLMMSDGSTAGGGPPIWAPLAPSPVGAIGAGMIVAGRRLGRRKRR